MGRAINRIIIHCSATPEGRDVSVEEIRRWHVEGNGWRDIGYHYVVALDGTIHRGRPESQVGAHVIGHNGDSLGICYVGGMTRDNRAPKDTRTVAQALSLGLLIADIRARLGRHVAVHGHNEFAPKACPSFDVQAERFQTFLKEQA